MNFIPSHWSYVALFIPGGFLDFFFSSLSFNLLSLMVLLLVGLSVESSGGSAVAASGWSGATCLIVKLAGLAIFTQQIYGNWE